MSSLDQLDRELIAWFAETATPAEQDAAADILLETMSTRQRPRWTFVPLLPRPMSATPGDAIARLAPPRRVAIVLVILGLLALAATAVWLGSQPRLPPPFGQAVNGLVAYEKGGDIFVVDPVTGSRHSVVAGPEQDVFPRWSLDGTRLAFVRGPDSKQRLVVVDLAGNVQSVSTGLALANVDPDGIAWSPDGSTVAVVADFVADRAVFLIDAHTGAPEILSIPYWGLEAYWRPPDGRELLFVGGTDRSRALYRYTLADGRVTEIPNTRLDVPTDDGQLRPIGWTPDGSRFAYHRSTGALGAFETHVVNVETGVEIVLDVGYGRISNDGSRIVGVATDGIRDWLCVAPVTGGECKRIEGSPELVDPTGWASLQWTPDDEGIRSDAGREGRAVLLRPNGGAVEEPPWAAEGAESWQRRAP